MARRGIIADMMATPQEATEVPLGYEVSVRGEQKQGVERALPLAAMNLVLSRHMVSVPPCMLNAMQW